MCYILWELRNIYIFSTFFASVKKSVLLNAHFPAFVVHMTHHAVLKLCGICKCTFQKALIIYALQHLAERNRCSWFMFCE